MADRHISLQNQVCRDREKERVGHIADAAGKRLEQTVARILPQRCRLKRIEVRAVFAGKKLLQAISLENDEKIKRLLQKADVPADCLLLGQIQLIQFFR